MNNSTRGGSRKGSGRPKKEVTEVLCFRIEKAEKIKLKAEIKKLIAKYMKSKS